MKLLTNSTSYLLLFCFSFLIISCGDGAQEGEEDTDLPPEKGFTISGDVFETPNAYLLFSSVLQYDSETMMDVSKIRNQFSFLFLDGEAISDNGKILYSTNTTHSSYHNIREIGGENVVDNIESVAISSAIYEQYPSTTTRVSISDIPTDVNIDNASYGDPVFAGISYPLANEDVASFTINSIDIDYVAMKGTIDCEYSISPSFDGAIIGKYVGEFLILVE